MNLVRRQLGVVRVRCTGGLIYGNSGGNGEKDIVCFEVELDEFVPQIQNFIPKHQILLIVVVNAMHPPRH